MNNRNIPPQAGKRPIAPNRGPAPQPQQARPQQARNIGPAGPSPENPLSALHKGIASRPSIPEIQQRAAAARAAGVKPDAIDMSEDFEFVEPPRRERPQSKPAASAAPEPRIRENANGGRQPAPPSIGQLRSALMRTTSQVAPADLPEVRSSDVLPGFFRVSLPSRCVPYAFLPKPFSEVYIRPLKVMDLAGITAGEKEKNFSMILDVLGGAIQQDIRDLTEPDFRFIMYWWRLNSFPRSPYTIRWDSRYGNSNESTITQPNLRIEELKMSAEEYASFIAKGIRFPTVRDSEAIREAEADAAQEFLIERAQYVYIDEETSGKEWFSKRIDRLNEGGIEMLEDIRDFAEKITHGVVEIINDHDKLFVPEKAIKHLRETADTLLDLKAKSGTSINPRIIMAYAERADELYTEANAIETALAEGKEVKPREEDIVLRLDMMSFFPSI